ncbi:MAG TPA: sulfatase-like hydrolase/transferase [Opitutaceae bacterium]
MKIAKLRLPLISCALALTLHAAPRPNIVFVLCDDLGFGDTGSTFQNARAAQNDPALPAFSTPQLDRVATEGLVLRNHYCPAPVCAPSRASLLLGVHQGHANVRDNQFDKALANNHTLATVLKQAGYATAAFGKWGLQGRGAKGAEDKGGKHGDPATWPAYPTKRGFDYYFGYVRHGDGHRHYPKEDGKQLWENDREVSADLDLCYTTDLFTARAKKWIVDQRAARPDQPFFLYLAYDTPHARLQNPPCPWPDGGGLRGGVQWTGKPGAMINTATGVVDSWMHPELAGATWDHDRNPDTPETAWPDVQKRYVNGVRRIDDAVGDLVQLLKDLGIDRETLIVFTSDNGPSKESNIPKVNFDPDFFAGFGPFTGIKRDVLEGGVREPTLVRWPGRVPAGRRVQTPSAMWDWMPTFAELAGLPPPAASDGVSLVPTLTGQGEQRPSTIYVEYFNDQKTPAYAQFPAEHRGRVRQQMQLVMEGGFTGVRYGIQSADDDFEIYDVAKDPRQEKNLAADPGFAALQQRMKARVLQVRRPNDSAPRPYDEAFMPPAAPEKLTKGKIACLVYEGNWPWVPEFSTLQPVNRATVPAIDLSAYSGKAYTGAAFTGYVHAPVDGEYTFTVMSDGGAELFLHDARVIDDDFGRTGDAVSGTIRLAAGWHPLRLYYRHAMGERRLSLDYSGPGIAKQPIPASALAVAGE